MRQGNFRKFRTQKKKTATREFGSRVAVSFTDFVCVFYFRIKTEAVRLFFMCDFLRMKIMFTCLVNIIFQETGNVIEIGFFGCYRRESGGERISCARTARRSASRSAKISSSAFASAVFTGGSAGAAGSVDWCFGAGTRAVLRIAA